jgi:hypothetical protein
MINPPITGNEALDYFLYQIYLGNAEATSSSTATSTSSTNVSTDPIVGIPYVNRYIHIKYATDNVGTGLSNVPTNKIYWGIYNSASTTESVNPADYTWYATTGFSTTKFLFYSNLGGRLIKFYTGEVKPAGGTWAIDPGTAIDLDVLIVPISVINNGDSAVTGVAAMLAALTGSITQSQLYADLGTRINLIDADGAVVGSVSYKVAQEAAARAAAVAAEANTRQTDILTETNARLANVATIDAQISTIQADVATLSGTPDYNNATTYAASAIVKYSGGLYRALSTTTGNLPTNTTYWQKIGDYASLGEAVAAQAAQITSLDTRVTTTEGGLAAEVTSRTTLASTVSTNNSTLTAAISSEASTRATADTANANNITTVAAIANAKNKSYSQTSAPSADLVTGDLWFDTDDNNKAYRYSGSAWVATDDTRIATNAAAITTETSARVSEDAAIASQITTLNSNFATNSAAISSEATTRANADTAISTTVTTLQSTVNTNLTNTNAAIVAEATTRATADTALSTSVTALTSTVNTDRTNAAAAVTSEATTRATADTALSTSIATLTSTVTNNDTAVNSLISTEATTRSTADTAISNTVTALTSTVNSNDTTVRGLIVNEATTRGTADTALASSISALTSTVTSNDTSVQALITTEATTRANADTALSNTVTTLTSTINTNDTAVRALVTSEATTRSSADTAISSTVSALTSTVAGKNKNYSQTTEPNTGMLTGDLWFDTDDNNKAYRYSGTAWVATDDSRIAANTAAIVSEATTRATNDSAISSTVTTLSSTVGTNTTAIATEASTRATETGNLFSKYSVKIDTNGYVSGFGLASTANNATPFSSFIVRADQFSIASPSGPGITPVIPFIVNTTTETIGNVTVPPGVYIDNAYIKYVNADKINAVNLSAISANLGTITSGDLSVGSSPALSGTTMTGTGSHLYSSGNFAFGNSTTNMVFDGTNVSLNGFANSSLSSSNQSDISSETTLLTFSVSKASRIIAMSSGFFYNNGSAYGSASYLVQLTFYVKNSGTGATLFSRTIEIYNPMVIIGATDRPGTEIPLSFAVPLNFPVGSYSISIAATSGPYVYNSSGSSHTAFSPAYSGTTSTYQANI